MPGMDAFADGMDSSGDARGLTREQKKVILGGIQRLLEENEKVLEAQERLLFSAGLAMELAREKQYQEAYERSSDLMDQYWKLYQYMPMFDAGYSCVRMMIVAMDCLTAEYQKIYAAQAKKVLDEVMGIYPVPVILRIREYICRRMRELDE